MSTIPIKPTPTPPQPTQEKETFEERFRRLEAILHAETWFSSSPNDRLNHWAFREIVGMGNAVVPLMLRDLQELPRLWVWALQEITGANPAPEINAGNVKGLTEAWLRWGKEHGYPR